MAMMLALGGIRRTLLASAVVLILAGFASLTVTDDEPQFRAPRFGSPTYGTTDPFDSLPSTTLTSRRGGRGRKAWRKGESIDLPRGLAPGTTTTNPSQDPDAQVDVVVPAAGTQVSAGQGPGSCTDVAITALTPDDCPPPDGDGPVIVDPGPSPSSDPGGGTSTDGSFAA